MIKVTLVLIVGLAAAGLLRRRPAALRHQVLAVTIACCAVMPAVETIVPGWELPILPARPALASQPAVLQDDAGASDDLQQAAVTRPAASAAWALALLPRIWGAGVVVGLLLLAVGLARLAWMASRARPIRDGPWAAAAAALASRAGLVRAPVILQSRHPSVLFTWGIRRPKILVPRHARDWSDERIGIVLGHELAHIRRGDWAVQLLAHGVRCAYWFNPLVWITCRRLRLESEHACDDEVLRHGVAASDYASELLALASLFKGARRPFFPAPAMARPSELERRVRVMLNARLDRAPIRRSSVVLIWLGLLAVSVPIAALSITPEPAPVVPSAIATAASTMASQPAGASAAAATVASRPEATAPSPSAERPAAARGATARQQPAALAGTVADQSGRFIPNIPLTLTDATTSVKVETATGQDGRFEMTGLTPGVYQLRVSKPGFKPHESPVELTAGATVRRNVVLHLGTLKETITVSTRLGGSISPAVGGISPAAPRAQQVAAPPADDPCSQSVDGGCVTPPRKLADVRPICPAHHAQAGTPGEVVIEAVIQADGSVAQLQPKPDSDPDFAAAAMHAIRLWKFSPTRLNGEPVEVDMTVKVTFQITK